MSKVIKMVKAELRSMKKDAQKELEHKRLCNLFKYNADGTPDIYSYGEFKNGVTSDEVKNFLRVYLGQLDDRRFKAAMKKYDDKFGAQTCAVAHVNGQDVTLYYRHDVTRIADAAFRNIPTYFD